MQGPPPGMPPGMRGIAPPPPPPSSSKTKRPVPTFEGLYSEAKDVLNVGTIGRDLQMEINNSISREFGLSHHLFFLTRRYLLSSYFRRGGVELKGSADTTKCFSADGAYRFSAVPQLQAMLHSNYRAAWSRTAASTWEDASTGQMTGVLQYEGDKTCSTLQVMKQDAEKCALAVDVVQQLTDRAALGCRAMLDREKRTAAGGWRSGGALALAAQYAHPQGTLLATCTTRGNMLAHISRRVCHYNKPGQDNVGLAAELRYDYTTGTSHAQVGWDFRLPNSGASVSGSITGAGACKGIVSERLNGSTVLNLSAEVDHSSNDFKFGIGVQVGPRAPMESTVATHATSLKVPNHCYDPLKLDRWRAADQK